MTRPTRAALATWALCACLVPAAALAQDSDILAVIQKSADDWNRGDLTAYVQCYEQSSDTTFVGVEVSRGMSEVLARYRRAYPDAAHMGTVSFSELSPRILTPDLAIVTGRFHLARAAEFGGDKAGIFTLVLRRGAAGWRIIHDHTSGTP